MDDEDSINPRQDEIDRFNSTIHIENGKRVFTYYWKVDRALWHTDTELVIKSR